MKSKGMIYTILSAVLFGIAPLLAMKVYALGGTPTTVVFLRSFLIIPILYILMKKDKEVMRVERYELKNIVMIAIFGSGLTTIMLFTSYQYIDVGTATTLHFLYPIFVAVLCVVVYHEVLDKYKTLALIIAIAGILCFIDFNNHGSVLGLFLALASSITYAFYMVELEKKKLTRMNPYKLSLYIAIFVALETIVYSIFVPSLTLVLPPIAYLYVFLIAICTSFLGVVLLQKGIAYLGSTTASIFCLFEPITSIVTGVLFLNEKLTFIKVLGCVIILSAVVLLVYANKRRSLELEKLNNQIND
ncbi:MAG: DMT family transporter [Erysipelotrichaceae bacterium]